MRQSLPNRLQEDSAALPNDGWGGDVKVAAAPDRKGDDADRRRTWRSRTRSRSADRRNSDRRCTRSPPRRRSQAREAVIWLYLQGKKNPGRILRPETGWKLGDSNSPLWLVIGNWV